MSDSSKSSIFEGAFETADQTPSIDEKRRFSGVTGFDEETLFRLFEIEEAYCRADFTRALKLIESLIDSGSSATELAVLTYRMVIEVTLADVEQAYRDYCRLKLLCDEGLEHATGDIPIGPYVLSALFVESIVTASLFDVPDFSGEIENFPLGMKAYFGYLLGMQTLRQGNYEEAVGIAYAYQTLVGQSMPESRVFLHLVAAIGNLMMDNVERAESEFDAAWSLGERYDIVTPFVVLNSFLFGFMRHHCRKRGIDESRRISALARTFRDGWFGLRQKCGLPSKGLELTTLQCCVGALAALGWSNSRIAEWLFISENTVKHHLTSAYQKTGMSNRKELRSFFASQYRAIKLA